MRQNRELRVSVFFALLVFCAAGTVVAQPLPADQAEGYIGTWALAAVFEGNTIDLDLEIAADEGVVKAALGSSFQPEPQLIDSITQTDEGLLLAYDANFGGNSMRIQVKAALADDELVGTFGDEVGLFSAEFTGVRAAESKGLLDKAVTLAADEESEEAPRRRRFGSITAELALDDGKELKVLYGSLKVDSEDHERLLALEVGEVFTFAGSRTIKLFTDEDLVFGETRIKAHNIAPNYPGVYGVWLKRVEDGWHLVFNEQGDVWGTQYEATTDVAEVALELAELEVVEEELLVELVGREDAAGGELRIVWGNRAWSAPFRVE